MTAGVCLTDGTFLSSSGSLLSFLPSSGFVLSGSLSLWDGMRVTLSTGHATFAVGGATLSSGTWAMLSVANACVAPKNLAAMLNHSTGIPMSWDSPLLPHPKNCSVQKFWSQSLVAVSASPPKSDHRVKWGVECGFPSWHEASKVIVRIAVHAKKMSYWAHELELH